MPIMLLSFRRCADPRGLTLKLVLVLASFFPLVGCATQTNLATREAVFDLTPRILGDSSEDVEVKAEYVTELRSNPVVAYQSGGRLIVLVRYAGGEPYLLNLPRLTFRQLSALEPEIWVGSYHVEELDHAIVDITAADGMRFIGTTQFRGRAIERTSTHSLVAGVVSQVRIDSAALGGAREVAIYRPHIAEQGTVRTVYVLDRAQTFDSMAVIVDDLIAREVIPPTQMVALPADSNRNQEMHIGLNPVVYEQYTRFFFQELVPMMRSRFRASEDPLETAIVGSSASATWVLNQSVSRPHARYWGAFSLSPRSSIPNLPGANAGEIVMGGGTFDSEYFATSLARCTEINSQGGSCRFIAVHSGHGEGAWDELLREMLIDWPTESSGP